MEKNNKKQEQVFREILNIFENWNDDWNLYMNNNEVLSQPLNADELAKKLASLYTIIEK